MATAPPPALVCGVIVNLVPHDVHYVQPDNVTRTFVKSTKPARLNERILNRRMHANGVIMSEVEYADAIDLPSPKVGYYYIVSMAIRTAYPTRTDLLSPGECIRDEKGNICGCNSFFVNPAQTVK